ncbi:EPIDERMAL PATTERNING FACTOR-like protein 1 [Vigna umbellata]|uniref:EPIDERMAL PATTERNING FACTOR-like protein 1 n=1 Tax=Vigna umbellata TaxID=87088 RepID=UPI001F5F32A0|nr:EPIDERMAL PATTERNING FACTOR-like protein 1 [Vigna umbellata]
MDTTVKQTLCGNVLLLILFCTLIFSSGAASIKDSEIGENLVSSTDRPKMLIGSSPPTCISRCNNCTPCKPILVPLPPPVPQQTHSTFEQPHTAFQRPDDFGPETVIWKCTCGGKLYNP